MLTKTITYTDYNGLERTETFYFNLTEAEVVEMELASAGGLSDTITKIIEAKDAPTLIKIFKDLILKSYGEKSPDGRRLIKNDEVREAFSQTEAYSKLFMELAFDADKATEFVNGITPNNAAKAIMNNSKVDVSKRPEAIPIKAES